MVLSPLPLQQVMMSWCIAERKDWRVDGSRKQHLKFLTLGKNKQSSFANLGT